MAIAQINGVSIFYQLIGDQGPWFALNTGGRRSHDEFIPLAKKIAASGFRVVLHDRRNTGASEVHIAGGAGEEEIWADDLAALLKHLNAVPAFIGGASSGARLSILVNQRHPDIVKALVLIRVTGGDTAAKRLPPKYYGQFIKAAQEGGMRAVCQTADYQERIRARPENEATLMAMSPDTFIQVQCHWLKLFTQGPIYPVMGVDEATLRAIKVPVFIIPGNDRTHASRNALDAAKLIPQSVVFQLPIEDQEIDIISFTDWAPYETEITQQVTGFLKGLSQ